jgi:carboxysome shell carbonic anhydrase
MRKSQRKVAPYLATPKSRKGGIGRRPALRPEAPQPAETQPASARSEAATGSAPASSRRDRQVNGSGTPKASRPTRPPRPKGASPDEIRRIRNGKAASKRVTPPASNNSSLGVAPRPVANRSGDGHPLTDQGANRRLADYESGVKGAFDRIVPVLKEIASHRCEPDFIDRAEYLAREELGLDLPAHLLEDAWISGLDMRRLFAWTLFETYRHMSDEFFNQDPLAGRESREFEAFLLDCGFHLMDVTPCADGRLAHAISYVLRLPYGPVRRKSYAGSLFDIENTVEKWVEVELRRFREGVPNTADAPTRYLKTVLYHFSTSDPTGQGCAAHGSDDDLAARSGWERLQGLRQAIENGFCCGASVELLLVGLDTDSDAIRVHVPDTEGNCDLEHWLDNAELYNRTQGLDPQSARRAIAAQVQASAPAGGAPTPGMAALIARLLENNISQIDYVRQVHGGCYTDIGHAERFIGAGIGFEEIQLRNLTYFAYLDTVEEGAPDLDVGIRIFTGLNIDHGLPAPVVVRFDYHGSVPGARERAVARSARTCKALHERYPELSSKGLLHTLQVVRDCDSGAAIEILGSSLEKAQSGH